METKVTKIDDKLQQWVVKLTRDEIFREISLETNISNYRSDDPNKSDKDIALDGDRDIIDMYITKALYEVTMRLAIYKDPNVEFLYGEKVIAMMPIPVVPAVLSGGEIPTVPEVPGDGETPTVPDTPGDGETPTDPEVPSGGEIVYTLIVGNAYQEALLFNLGILIKDYVVKYVLGRWYRSDNSAILYDIALKISTSLNFRKEPIKRIIDPLF